VVLTVVLTTPKSPGPTQTLQRRRMNLPPQRKFQYHSKTTMTTQITQQSFEAFLKCPTKSRLYFNGANGIESAFGEWQRRTQERYNAAAPSSYAPPFRQVSGVSAFLPQSNSTNVAIG